MLWIYSQNMTVHSNLKEQTNCKKLDSWNLQRCELARSLSPSITILMKKPYGGDWQRNKLPPFTKTWSCLVLYHYSQLQHSCREAADLQYPCSQAYPHNNPTSRTRKGDSHVHMLPAPIGLRMFTKKTHPHTEVCWKTLPNHQLPQGGKSR